MAQVVTDETSRTRSRAGVVGGDHGSGLDSRSVLGCAEPAPDAVDDLAAFGIEDQQVDAPPRCLRYPRGEIVQPAEVGFRTRHDGDDGLAADVERPRVEPGERKTQPPPRAPRRRTEHGVAVHSFARGRLVAQQKGYLRGSQRQGVRSGGVEDKCGQPLGPYMGQNGGGRPRHGPPGRLPGRESSHARERGEGTGTTGRLDQRERHLPLGGLLLTGHGYDGNEQPGLSQGVVHCRPVSRR